MAVTWQMVRDAFETTDGVMPPAQARENLAKALAPLFSGTGPGGAVNTVTATGRIVATPSDGTGDVVLTHADSGVLSGTYGSSTQIPVFTVDATGHITLASTAAVATPSSIPWANLTGFPSVTAGNGLIGGGYLAGSVTLSVVFAGSGSANAVSRSDHRHDLQTGALDGVLPVSRGGTAISSPGSVPGNLRWNGSNYIVDFTVFATASSLADYLPLAGGNMSGPIHALGTGNNSDIVLDVFSTGQTFARLALNHYGEIVFGDGTGGVGPIVSFDTSSTKLDIRNYGVKCVDLTTGAIDQTGQLYNHQTNAGILTSAQLNGGDLLLSGNSGTANIKICGSIAANTAGVAPYMYFAGQPNGVGLTGGGMMFQLNSTNGLDLWSWNNTAWVRKSTITSSGTIALVGGTSSQVMKADGTVGKVAFSTDMSGTLQASQFPGLTGDVTAPAGSFDTTLKSIITAGGYVGSSSTVPMIRWDSKGRLTGVDSVSISPLAIGALALTGGTISGPLTLQSNLILPRGSFRDLVGSTSYTAYYGSYVIPTANNYSIAVNQSGADTTLNGSNLVLLCVNNAAVLNATATGVAVSGVLSSTGAISTSSSVISGNAKMAPWSVSPGTFAFFGHSSQDNSTNGNSGYLQANNGAIYLCAPSSGPSVNIQIASANRMVVDSSGVSVSGAFGASGSVQGADVVSTSTLSWSGGIFRDYTFGLSITCLYPSGVTPAAANYALAIDKNGNTSVLHGLAGALLAVNGNIVAQATAGRLSVFGLASSTTVETSAIKAAGTADINLQSPLTFSANASVVITSSSYILPAASAATQTILVQGESVGPVTNYLRVPTGVSWSLWARNDAGDRVQYSAGQSINMYLRVGLLIAGPYIAGVGCDWHLLHV